MRRCTATDPKNHLATWYPACRAYRSIGGRFGECGPDTIRNLYAFFGIRCPLTYMDFQDAGFHGNGSNYDNCGPWGISLSNSISFFTHKIMGLDTKIRSATNLDQLLTKLEMASEKKRPVIMPTIDHIYLILPHKIINKSTHGYTIKYRLWSEIYEELNIGEDLLKKYPGKLFPCLNSIFDLKCPENAFSPEQNQLAFASCDLIFRTFHIPNFIEVKGIKTGIHTLKTHPYRWRSVQKEYKVHLIKRKKTN